VSDSPQDGPGAELKTAREGMDVSTREVADALNLPVNVIEALEADDYERLPPTVFTRGYLRSYARLLELSPESLLARYPEVTEEIDAITGELPVARVPDAAPMRSLGIAAVVGVILIALLFWLLGDDERPAEVAEPTVTPTEAESLVSPDAAAVTEASAEGPTAAAAPEPAASETSEEPAGATAETGRQQPGEQVPETATPVITPVETAQQPPAEPESSTLEPAQITQESETAELGVSESPSAAGVQAAAPVTPSFREQRITEFGDDEVTLVFSEDCWVEVKSADGENLYSDLNRTGRTLVLTGRAPFRILLGYAPGVSLSFNGEPVALERYSRNNVANLVLGE